MVFSGRAGDLADKATARQEEASISQHQQRALYDPAVTYPCCTQGQDSSVPCSNTPPH